MKTYISKNLPNGTTIYEKILLAKFESLYFKKDDDILKKFTDKLSKNEFWIPLKEFNLEYKAQKVQSNINSLLFKLRNDVSIEAFYQIMSDLAFSPDQTLQTLCQVILYWQMQMAPQSFSFEIESYMRQIIDNIMELKNDLIMVFAHFLESSITFINMQDKNNYKIRNFDVDKPVDTLCLTVSRNADIHILHYTRAVLPESIYEQANFNHPLTEDDLVLKKGANSYDRNEERKYDQGEVKNYEQPAKKDSDNALNLEDLEISEEFASGSFGTLSLALDKKTRSHKYAIKTISTTKKEVEEIMREIQIWEMLEKSEKTRSLPRYYNYFREEINSKIRKTVEYHIVFDYFPQSLKDVIDDLFFFFLKYGVFPC